VISPSSGIVVRRGQQRENPPLPQSSVQQRVIVTSQTGAQATAHSSVQFVAQIAVIERELSKSHPEQSEEIKRQLESLKEELTKKQPDSSKLKKTLRWALECDVNTFLKLAKAVAEWLGVL
jgi:hypothetical protein